MSEDRARRRARLSALLEPSSFVLIGASDKSNFSKLLEANLTEAGWADATFLVNRRADRVHGLRAYASCADLPGPVDLAFVMVPAPAVGEALRDAASAGVRGAVVLSSGFAEAGPDGERRQRELRELAEELDIAVLGPNCLGFVDVAGRIPAITLSRPPSEPGHVALISQSGASCAAMKEFAALANIGLSHLITVGNEAMVTVGDLVDVLVDDPEVRAIALFIEAIRDPRIFTGAVRRAAAAGKPVVALKAGRSELAARAASAHTGALVGDDRVIDAVFRAEGVIRVDTVEDLLVTAGVAAHVGRMRAPGVAVVSISGGACDVAADLAESVGLELPQFSDRGRDALEAAMPDYGHVQNPLDITGAAITDPSLFTTAITEAGQDASIGAVLAVNSLPWRYEDAEFYGQPLVDAIGEGFAAIDAPGLYSTQVVQPFTATTADTLRRGGVRHAVPGLGLAINALARVARWSARPLPVGEDHPRPSVVPHANIEIRPYSEVDARALLEQAGVPCVPAVVAHTPDEAVAAAERFGGDVAMKVVSAHLAHKSDIGGVRLGVATGDAAAVFDGIVAAGRTALGVGRDVDGVLVSPMRAPATELLVGVTRDPDWGLVLAVGLGGVFVEVLDDIGLVPLPTTREAIRALLEDLRGAPLLRGVRGRTPADLDVLVHTIGVVAELAADLGDRLEALEINPLRVDGARIEALDALVEWRSPR